MNGADENILLRPGLEGEVVQEASTGGVPLAIRVLEVRGAILDGNATPRVGSHRRLRKVGSPADNGCRFVRRIDPWGAVRVVSSSLCARTDWELFWRSTRTAKVGRGGLFAGSLLRSTDGPRTS